MKFRKLFTAFALVCAGVSPAQTVSAPLTLDPAVRYGVLENGLTYYIRQNNYPEDQVEFYTTAEWEAASANAHYIWYWFTGIGAISAIALIIYAKMTQKTTK